MSSEADRGQALLHRLAGRWRGAEMMADSAWARGGPAESLVEAEIALGGSFVFQIYRQSRQGMPSFESRSVFGWDRLAGHAVMYLFDVMGFVPDAPAPGTVEEGELVFTRQSARGRGQHRFRFDNDGSYGLTVRFSPPEGSWGTVMEGRYIPLSTA